MPSLSGLLSGNQETLCLLLSIIFSPCLWDKLSLRLLDVVHRL
jgi:hypothetical protein